MERHGHSGGPRRYCGELSFSGESVLLVGASRGLGLAIAREYLSQGARVVATVRGPEPTPLHVLVEEYRGLLEIESVDITELDQLAALHARLAGHSFGLVFVNAGVTNDEAETIATVSDAEFSRLMLTNALAPMRFIEAFAGLASERATLAVMSSGQGSIENNTRGGFEIYRASKSALNQLMRSYAARTQDDGHTLLLLAPGWIRGTGVGGPNAPLTIEESIPRLVRTIQGSHGKGGLQFLDYRGETVSW
ncbi:3-oxoacyl-ACP reductase [Arthrobacter stackebrandtii]|nr:SDR family NAD(P)-dependent oxidoreductase [Arthrobacter stackebrandtii]PYH01376.1 3-oxoacyl-ACP reductase [Arthrobacter stackebrandtii]